ncbi:unnamed protein product [Staurois parvus]|uniref:Uncharacterized protein n=1 Tax=Staurois parvus TaxID=386267 RepID=A0ABN9B6N1_9NEOB|nr:unnamed protein product [Staurois parvus]
MDHQAMQQAPTPRRSGGATDPQAERRAPDPQGGSGRAPNPQAGSDRSRTPRRKRQVSDPQAERRAHDRHQATTSGLRVNCHRTAPDIGIERLGLDIGHRVTRQVSGHLGSTAAPRHMARQ